MSLRQRLSPSTLLRIAMSCLLIGNGLSWLVHPASPSGVNWLDGMRGLMIGLTLGLIYLFFKAKRLSAAK